MNTPDITRECKMLYKEYLYDGRTKQNEDSYILSYIIHLYNNTELDWEEVRFLWLTYLEKGNLEISTAMQMARQRIMDDIRETEEELIRWLHRGI